MDDVSESRLVALEARDSAIERRIAKLETLYLEHTQSSIAIASELRDIKKIVVRILNEKEENAGP